MESAESELLVDISVSNCYGEPDSSAADDGYNINPLKESLVQESKKAGTPEHEGTINCAMDLFAPDQSSISSANSRVSAISIGGTARQIRSSSSEPKDTSDSEKTGPYRAKVGSNYMSLMNEHDQQDSVSLASDSSVNEVAQTVASPKNPSTPLHFISAQKSCVSPHFPNSNITFPSSCHRASPSGKQWTVFGDDKENTMPVNKSKPKYIPVRPPPAIPERKSLRLKTQASRSSPLHSLPEPSSSPAADLLSMDMNDLQIHLSDPSSSLLPQTSAKPAVPPRKSLFSTSSIASKAQSDDSDHDLITLPEPEGHVNHAHSSSASSSPLPATPKLTMTGPPIPPRKNFPKPSSDLKLPSMDTTSTVASNFDPFLNFSQNTESQFVTKNSPSSSPHWIDFEAVGSCSVSVAETNDCIPASTDEDAKYSNPDDFKEVGDLQNCDNISDKESLTKEEDDHWGKLPPSPNIRASAKRKKTGGIGYLSLENDDCDHVESAPQNSKTNKVSSDKIIILLPEKDLSPEKPQSQWATFQNEDDDEEIVHNDENMDNISCGAVSLPSYGLSSSGFAGSLNDVDGDLEDDFGLSANRLSVEIPNLKGFNRADKGSQNNLVDFSDDRGSVAISIGSHDDGDEDVETIFDLTAQGDSLKRKRPKGSITVVTSTVENEIDEISEMNDRDGISWSETGNLYHVGPAGLDDAVFSEEGKQLNSQNGKMSETKTPDVLEPCSSQSSRAGTPAANPVESVNSSNCSKSVISTNPFWSPSTSGPSSGSLSSSNDSPFDNIVFNNPKSSADGLSMPSTPLHIKPVSNPSTPVQLIRIPPPPSSRSRSSSRQRRSSQAQDRIRNMSHESSSAKRLELDSVSDLSQSATTLSSPRAFTPIEVINNKVPDNNQSSQPSPAPTSCSDEIFDPFSNHQISNSLANNENANDMFCWMDDSQPDFIDGGNKRLSNNSMALAEKEEGYALANEESCGESEIPVTFKNTNTNANVQDLVSSPAVPECNVTKEGQNEVEDVGGEGISAKAVSTPTPDPLSELKKTISVESPLGIQVVKKPLLPEIDIVDSKASWDVFMRFPPTKRAMSNRKWVPIHIKLSSDQVDNPQVKMYYTKDGKEPFRTVSLASHQMQISKPKLQAHYSDDGQVLGKLHAVKLMVIYYKEKQTFSPRKSLSRNAVGFKHACRGKQSIKFGFSVHYDVISFLKTTQDAMFAAHKLVPKSKSEEHTATVKYHSRDEFLVEVLDEVQAVVGESGSLEACKVRVHFYVASFLSGDPMAKITINDRKLEGKEVVRREDIIPTSLEGWIDVRDPELHESCTTNSLDGDSVGTCTLYPPDACMFELLRFATSYTEAELPLVVKSNVSVKGARLQLRSILRMSCCHSGKDPLKQVACEDIMIRFPVPEEWGVFFRVDGKFRNHSVRAKRAAKPTTKPPLETGAAMQASVGVAKYEKAYHAIVWRIPRLPEKNAVQNTPRVFTCRIELASDQDLKKLLRKQNVQSQGNHLKNELDTKFKWCEVEYTMIGPTASKVCVRSVCLPNTDRAEKFVSYRSHYFYKVGIGVTVDRVCAEGEEDPADICVSQ